MNRRHRLLIRNENRRQRLLGSEPQKPLPSCLCRPGLRSAPAPHPGVLSVRTHRAVCPDLSPALSDRPLKVSINANPGARPQRFLARTSPAAWQLFDSFYFSLKSINGMLKGFSQNPTLPIGDRIEFVDCL